MNHLHRGPEQRALKAGPKRGEVGGCRTVMEWRRDSWFGCQAVVWSPSPGPCEAAARAAAGISVLVGSCGRSREQVAVGAVGAARAVARPARRAFGPVARSLVVV